MAGMNVEEKQDMCRFVLDVNEEFGTTVVLIEHDMGVVMDISDRVVVLSAGPGTRPIGDFVIDLPRPRDVSEVRLQPHFLALHAQIWHAMKEEVMKAYVQQTR
jgi:NitT/TauT family transport system ATP-binding protein